MSQRSGTEAIPQIFSELNSLSHVELEYSSTVKSYKVVTSLLGMIKDTIQKEITTRTEEMTKIFSTEQGIGIRKIMIEHYQRLSLLLNEEYRILDKASSIIYQKHKLMRNSLSFIEPVVKEIEHKTKVLQKQLTEVNQKVAKFSQIRNTKLYDFTHSKTFYSETTNKKTSQQVYETSKTSRETPEKQFSSPKFSLFSLRKFDKLETESEFDQVQTFLELKREEVQEFVRIEKNLTEKTVDQIYQIFQQILGKGLEKMESKLLSEIKSYHVLNTAMVTSTLLKNLKNSYEIDSESSTDLQCYEKIEELFENPMNFEKIKRVKKRLYHSTFIGGVEITKSIEEKFDEEAEEVIVSPTFNSVAPLILDSQRDINQFNIMAESTHPSMHSTKKSRNDTISYQIFDSFSKENFNSIKN